MAKARRATTTRSKKRSAQVRGVATKKSKSTKKVRRSLSKRKREELVLEFRIKARKLARSILRKWNSRLDLQEVDSLVDLSLCEAVKNFDPDRGTAFMTFLYYHLRGNLIRAISSAANANVVPGALEEDREETRVRQNSAELNGDANATDIAEVLCNHQEKQPDEVLLQKQMARLSSIACAKLDPLEQEVIERIYIKEQQLMDIAGALGYSRCHISRVKRRAIEAITDDIAELMQNESENMERPRPQRITFSFKKRKKSVGESETLEAVAA